MIEFRNVVKNFGKLEVLKNISTRMEAGQSIALIGPNGCGKTTLIKSILGMVKPHSGQILVNENDIEQSIDYRRQIGYMPQIGRYPQNMTIAQVIDMLKSLRQDQSTLDHELVESFKLADIADKKLGTLSGGTTQKVSAVIAFLFNPSILILDEPTAGLDPLSSEILRDKILREKAGNKLILITSHLLNELDELVSHIMYMQDGRISFFDTLENVARKTEQAKISKAISVILKRGSYE
ncbi:MAG TPA: ABC transporter ATP-binding protein [Saprospiraceae bacterium]|nr:ABC transporter ATP-binding protein [Saprospiraceae bacterium]